MKPSFVAEGPWYFATSWKDVSCQLLITEKCYLVGEGYMKLVFNENKLQCYNTIQILLNKVFLESIS